MRMKASRVLATYRATTPAACHSATSPFPCRSADPAVAPRLKENRPQAGVAGGSACAGRPSGWRLDFLKDFLKVVDKAGASGPQSSRAASLQPATYGEGRRHCAHSFSAAPVRTRDGRTLWGRRFT